MTLLAMEWCIPSICDASAQDALRQASFGPRKFEILGALQLNTQYIAGRGAHECVMILKKSTIAVRRIATLCLRLRFSYNSLHLHDAIH